MNKLLNRQVSTKMAQQFAAIPMTHVKCRAKLYKRPAAPAVERFQVPDEKVPWDNRWDKYKPTEFTLAKLITDPIPVYADPEIMPMNGPKKGQTFSPKWNEVDGKVNRKSFHGPYKCVDGRPQNPVGRTGMTGRGALGRWGPNHAADPIVTRWKRDGQGKVVTDPKTKKQILQFVAIERADTKDWAIPGGMVDPGENVNVTLKREFGEEALNSMEASPAQMEQIRKDLDKLFKTGGKQVYQGYVDDPRNTDNSWMETTAYNFHDESGKSVGQFKLLAGDDAKKVRWTDINGQIKLFASHEEFVKTVARLHDAHW